MSEIKSSENESHQQDDGLAGDSNVHRFQHAGFLQLHVVEGQIEKNLQTAEQQLAQLNPPESSLIVLPEMWATGFVYSHLPAFADMFPELIETMRQWAQRYQIVLAGTLVEKEQRDGSTHFYNTLFVIDETGVIGAYRKQRLFTGWGENLHFSAGSTTKPLQTKYGKIGCLVCFDLRFPELARVQCQQGADILICSAMWPDVRIHHWNILLQARAIENQIFVVGCNAVGMSGNSQLGGRSTIYSPDGTRLVGGERENFSQCIELSWAIQKQVRSRFNTIEQEVS